MIFKQNKNKSFIINIINKKYVRNINTDKLYELMYKMQNNEVLQKATKNVNNNEFIEKMNKLKEKVNIEIDKKNYESIQEQLKDSYQEMKSIREQFKVIKEKSFNVAIEIKEEKEILQENKLDTLNKGLKNIRELNEDDKIILEKTKIINDNTDIYINKISNSKKSIFDVEWLQPFLDFMNNHSTLVLTIGSGLVMGGMWYMNNVGMINIGNLLTRLGIQIFSGLSQNTNGETNRDNIEITIPQQLNQATNTDRQAVTGFFRQLGEKVLKLIDIYIERMKEKTQKYK